MGGRIRKLLQKIKISSKAPLSSKGAGRFTLVNLPEGLSNYRNRFIPLLTITSLSTIFLLSLFLSILPSTNEGKAADNTNTALGSNDTGKATLNRVSISQAGTGSSVTINSKTYTEDSNTKTNRNVLIHNVVKYDFAITVNTPGLITLSFTMPANNEIDSSSIANAAGCLNGSKLQKTEVDGKQSYANNQAICVIRPNKSGLYVWSISTTVWGGNGQDISPASISIGTITTKNPAESIHLMGGLQKASGGFSNIAVSSQEQYTYVKFNYNIYGGNRSQGLGSEPIDKATIQIDLSSLPLGVEVDSVSPSCVNLSQFSYSFTKGILSINSIRSGPPTACESNVAISSVYNVTLKIPTSSLPNTKTNYKIYNKQTTTTSLSGQSITHQGESGSFSLGKYSYGKTDVNFRSNLYSWNQNYASNGASAYPGETIVLRPRLADSFVYNSNYSSNVNYCTTWNPTDIALTGEFAANTYNTLGSSIDIEYGIVGNDMTVAPDSSQATCGKHGDNKTGQIFFASLDDAQKYASNHNQKINAIRLHASKVTTGTVVIGDIPAKVISTNVGGKISINTSATADDWSKIDSNENSDSSDKAITTQMPIIPGAIGHAVQFTPASQAPGSLVHTTIKLASYNQDENVVVSMTIPKGLTPISGSFTYGNKQLVNGSDVVVAKNDNSVHVVKFYLGKLGSDYTIGSDGYPHANDNSGNGVALPDLGFDLVVDTDTSLNSTLRVQSNVSGTGSSMLTGLNQNYGVCRNLQWDLAVATKKEFNYSLLTSANTIALGDDLAYTYTNSNNTDTTITNLDEISVLPYNNDSRNTIGLIDNAGSSHGSSSTTTSPYTISNYKVTDKSGNDASSKVKLYYTTNTKVRDYEKGSSSTTTLDTKAIATDSSISWIEYNPTNGSSNTSSSQSQVSSQLPNNVTAIRWKKSTLKPGDSSSITLTLTNINADNPTTTLKPVINNDITYINADGIDGLPLTHQLPTTTTYTGEQIGLSIANPDITVNLNPNEAKTDIAKTLNYTVNTKNGYTLSLATTKDLTKQDSSNNTTSNSGTSSSNNTDNSNNASTTYPSLAKKPIAGEANWAIRLQDSNNWQTLKTTNNPYTLLQTSNRTKLQSNYTSTYGISTDYNITPGTYEGEVTYTLTAGM